LNDSRITSYLTGDHTRLDALLDRALRGPDSLDRAAYAAFRSGLLRHIAIEEKVLFPAVRRALGGVALDAMFELRIEHAAITSLLVPTPDVALCRELEVLLLRHNEKEEGALGVYALCERALSDAESHELAGRAEAYPAIRVARHFDGPRVYRTAELALAAASRMKIN
jgi:hypothetical protein